MPHRLNAGPPLSMKEVSSLLGVSIDTVKRWREETLPAPFTRNVLTPCKWEVKPEDLRGWLLDRAERFAAILR